MSEQEKGQMPMPLALIKTTKEDNNNNNNNNCASRRVQAWL